MDLRTPLSDRHMFLFCLRGHRNSPVVKQKGFTSAFIYKNHFNIFLHFPLELFISFAITDLFSCLWLTDLSVCLRYLTAVWWMILKLWMGPVLWFLGGWDGCHFINASVVNRLVSDSASGGSLILCLTDHCLLGLVTALVWWREATYASVVAQHNFYIGISLSLSRHTHRLPTVCSHKEIAWHGCSFIPIGRLYTTSMSQVAEVFISPPGKSILE